jgi:hypothetical protein
MLLRRKQKPNGDEQLVPHLPTWQATESEKVRRSNSGAARFAEFSRLSVKMVDLSLQEAQRDPTLRGTVPNQLSAVSSPLLWPSTALQTVAEPLAKSAGRPGTAVPRAAVAAVTPLNPPQAHGTPRELRIPNFAVLYSRARVILRDMTDYWNGVPRTLGSWLARLRVTGSDAVGSLCDCWKSVLNDYRLATLRARLLGGITIAAQRTDFIRQRAVLLIGSWSRSTATTAQFLAERISAKLRILAYSQPLRRLRHACGKNLRVLTARAPVVWAVMEKKFVAHRSSRPAVPTKRATGRSHLDQQ